MDECERRRKVSALEKRGFSWMATGMWGDGYGKFYLLVWRELGVE